MSKTIDDFRNFFREDKSKRKFDVKETIEDVISLTRDQLEHGQIEIRFNPSSLVVHGYPNEFKQVLLNMVQNSKDAILKNKNIDVGKIELSINNHSVIVSDNGGGIPEKILLRVFEPYFSTKESGTGIGLFMCKTIVEQNLGGEISVRNIDGGSEFRITLPKTVEKP